MEDILFLMLIFIKSCRVICSHVVQILFIKQLPDSSDYNILLKQLNILVAANTPDFNI